MATYNTNSRADLFKSGKVDLEDLNVPTSAASGQVLTVQSDGTSFDFEAPFDGAYSSLTGTPTIPSNLSDLSNVSDSGATTGQALAKQADGTYAFETISASVSNLSDLSDVSTSGATTGDVLTRQADNTYAFENPSSSSASIYHNTYVYEASSGQTNFTGADDDGYTLSFSDDQTMVFLNGVMLVKTTDYSEDSDLAGITLVESANVGDIILISTWEGTQKS